MEITGHISGVSIGLVVTGSNTSTDGTFNSPGSVFRTISMRFNFETFTFFIVHHPAVLALNTVAPVRSKEFLVSAHKAAFIFLIIRTVISTSSWVRNTFSSDGMDIVVGTSSTESYHFDVIFVFTSSDISFSTKTTLAI
jgi:hypothetical protein